MKQTRRHFGLVALGMSLATAPASAALISNGGFETATSPEPSNAVTFSSWSELSSDSGTNSRYTVATVGGKTIAGDRSAELTFGNTSGGAIRQAVSGESSQFTFSADFAALSPDGGALATTRYFQVVLKHSSDGMANNQINLRVIKSGQVEVYDQGISNFRSAGSLTALFVPDSGTAGKFDTETLVTSGADKNVNNLTITGDYSGSSPTYSITLNGSTVSNLNYFHGTAPTAGVDISAVAFVSTSAAKNFLIDNVSLVPEPAALGLLAMAALPMMRRRRV